MRAKALERCASRGGGVSAGGSGGNFVGLYAEWQKRSIQLQVGVTEKVFAHWLRPILQLALLNRSAQFGSFHG